MASSHQPGWPDWPAYLDKFCLGFIWEISARFPGQGKAKDPGDESWCQIRETKQTTFAPIITSATLKDVSLQLWCSLSCGKYEGNARQCHPERKNSSSLHPCNRAEVTLGTRGFSLSVSGFCQGFAARVNDLCPTKLFVAREKKTGSGNQGRAEVFIWQNFQPAYRDLGWKNWDLGNRASPPSHVYTSKILQSV